MLTLMLACAPALRAYDFVTGEGLRFVYTADSTAVMLCHEGLDADNADAYAGSLLVPELVTTPGGQMVPVCGVSPLACVCCGGLQEVMLAEGIEQIGYAAFSDCEGLAEVKLPASLVQMGDLCFYRCPSLVRVAVPASVRRVGQGSFGFCTALGEVSLCEGLGSIAPRAFYHCQSLTSIALPSTLTQMGQYAFAYCTSLQRISVSTPPLAITEDVFEGLDCSQCQLVVPHCYFDLYAQAPVWQDFALIDVGGESLPEVWSDTEVLMQLSVVDGVLMVQPLGDAPVLVYDMHGRRLAVCPADSGVTTVQLLPAQTYIVKCGIQSRKVNAGF